MDADFSVELGPPSEDATLQFPWESGPSGTGFLDLKLRPELLPAVEEAVRYPELGRFLKTLNARGSLFQTAKCDAWFDREISAAEQIYERSGRFGCYVDLVFDEANADSRFSFFRHEDLAGSLVKLLKKAPEIAAAVEIVIRRCYYRQSAAAAGAQPGSNTTIAAAAATNSPEGLHSGFYFTLYVFAYGDDEAEARRPWQVAMQLAANAILQLSSTPRAPN